MVDNRLIPILYMIVIFDGDKIPSKMLNKFQIFLHAGWGTFILMCIVVWILYYLDSYLLKLNFSEIDGKLSDIFVTKFIQSISNKINNYHSDQIIGLVVNTLEFLLFLLFAASMFGHFRWEIEAGKE